MTLESKWPCRMYCPDACNSSNGPLMNASRSSWISSAQVWQASLEKGNKISTPMPRQFVFRTECFQELTVARSDIEQPARHCNPNMILDRVLTLSDDRQLLLMSRRARSCDRFAARAPPLPPRPFGRCGGGGRFIGEPVPGCPTCAGTAPMPGLARICGGPGGLPLHGLSSPLGRP